MCTAPHLHITPQVLSGLDVLNFPPGSVEEKRFLTHPGSYCVRCHTALLNWYAEIQVCVTSSCMKTCCVFDPALCAHGATDSLAQFHSPQYYVFGPDAWKLTATNTPIVARINTDTATRRTWEVRCDEGHYCIAGERFPCPAGRYGNERVRCTLGA